MGHFSFGREGKYLSGHLEEADGASFARDRTGSFRPAAIGSSTNLSCSRDHDSRRRSHSPIFQEFHSRTEAENRKCGLGHARSKNGKSLSRARTAKEQASE